MTKKEKNEKKEIEEIKKEVENLEEKIEEEVKEESNKILSSIWVLGLVFLIVGIVVGLIAGSFLNNSTSTHAISPNEAKQLAANTIKSLIEKQAQMTGVSYKVNVKPLDVKEVDNFYNVTIEVSVEGPLGKQTQKVNVFVTKDGKYVTAAIIPALKEAPKETNNGKMSGENKFYYEIKNKTEKPKVIVAVMANCPFGNQIEPLIKEIVDLFGNKIEVEPRYIFYPGKNPYTQEGEKGSDNKNYWSLHGNYEMDEGILEYVVWKLYGTKTWIDFVNKVDKQCLSPEITKKGSEEVQKCALNIAKEMGLDVNKIMDYYNTHKKEIIKEQYDLTSKIGINGSPTIIINGEVYKGPRTAEALKEAICSAFINPPKECNKTLSNQETQAQGSCG